MRGKESAFDSVMTMLDHSGAFTRSETERANVADLLLIVNPGSRRAERALDDVRLALRSAGFTYELAGTSGPGDATTLVRERLAGNPERYGAVFILGGDGTAMETATALAEIDGAPPLGIIPVGTANVLARTVGIPMNARHAVRALLDADAQRIDLGQVVGGPSFAIGLGIGLDASMIGGTSAALKKRLGYVAYAFAALRAGIRLERFHATLQVDGASQDVETSSILVANFGTVLGGTICFGEHIDHRDGLLDVAVYSPRSRLDGLRIFWRMLFGGVADDRCVRILRGRRIRIDTVPPRRMQADGELLGNTPVEIEALAGAIRLLVPRTTR